MTDIKFDHDLIRKANPNLDSAQFEQFKYQYERAQLDPVNRQIYAVLRWNSTIGKNALSVQVSIDGFRLVAQRSGDYSGQSGPFWCGDDGIWKDVWISKTPPVAARVGVWRDKFKEPCWGVARFEAYAQTQKGGGLSMMWAKMPDVMIAKCAEALALRKAFPQELSGLYTADEMAQDSQNNTPKTTRTKTAVHKDIKTFVYNMTKKRTEDDLVEFLKTDEVKALADELKREWPEEYENVSRERIVHLDRITSDVIDPEMLLDDLLKILKGCTEKQECNNMKDVHISELKKCRASDEIIQAYHADFAAHIDSIS